MNNNQHYIKLDLSHLHHDDDDNKPLHQPLACSVCMKQISYTVGRSLFTPTTPLLHPMSCCIKSSSITACRGHSGSGKSIFLDLLAGYCSRLQGIITGWQDNWKHFTTTIPHHLPLCHKATLFETMPLWACAIDPSLHIQCIL